MTLKPAWPQATYAKHQEEGIQWMLNQEVVGYSVPNTQTIVRGGILGDEMGLGKTIQALGLIVNSKAKSTLIITPLAVRKQWEDAAKRCNLNIYTAEKTMWKAHTKILPFRQTVFIGHYDKVLSDISMFLEIHLDRFILDEAHRIRNINTSLSENVLKIKATHKWALTATPIVNKLNDAVTYLKFVGFPLGDSKSWCSSYEDWVHNSYLARSLNECEPPPGFTIPPKPICETLLLDFTNSNEEKVYNSIYDNLESQWRNANAMSGRQYMLAKFSILMRLRQVSVNPQIYIKARQKEPYGWMGPEFNYPSRKFDEMSYLLRDSYESKESNRWIIFCQFHEEMELLSSFLKAFPFISNVLQYHGGMSLKVRDEMIQQSNVCSSDGKQDVFLIQIQAGGTGLNLQHYNRIIFTSPWWTSALLDQAMGRAVRIGQKKAVKVYWLKLKAENSFSIDDFILEKANTKRELATIFQGWSAVVGCAE